MDSVPDPERVQQAGSKLVEKLKGWKNKALKILLAIVLIVIGLLLFLRNYVANWILFHPVKPTVSLNFTNFEMSIGGGRLSGIYVPCHNEKLENPKTILYFHGNAGNASHRGSQLQKLCKLGHVLIMDYSGYGNSKGSPTESQLYIDGQMAYDKVCKDVGWENVVLYGVSLGGAVAVDVARNNPCHCLVLQSTFASTCDFVPSLIKPLCTWFPSISKIAKVQCPILMMHSKTDEIVPYSTGRRLFEAAVEPKEFVEIQGGHNSTIYDDKMLETMKGFVYRKRKPQGMLRQV